MPRSTFSRRASPSPPDRRSTPLCGASSSTPMQWVGGGRTVNFTDMKRVDLIKEIAAEFELIANRLSETEVATVASVVELEPQHLAEIAKRAQKLTGPKNVKLKTVIDKSLLAGIIIRYGNSGSKLSLITLRLLNVVCEFKNY
ncbi:hypothetical protein SASPL_117714 [Salvia splendens]|uniref:F-type H+-transporting ATPase subunit delta n=1 Tax=Salvia splendens TaxID=180675 RepID=A0A8X8XWA5_SALSN|nr:hypothetical protein SASPL_117714 [Salvia splendens]